ncbi:hypothetical protein PDESU_01586 [Pontiella desulfatans]|uniref:Glycoside hydrolase family 5 domain-containing protein n=1 Tax=Pontiella desulfatans TaxID=2750659 RepID=A0A6C2TZE1_PONDE|nr:hypothetical protein [Pontiella desulfatans]VGO13032.1 hypothetical protein PDESU_01586 [Pontiella desulfatans]
MKTICCLLLMCLSLSSVSADGLFQKIIAKDGTLYFQDGTEVNLWGVNFQPMLSFEHASRMHNQGVLMPLKVQDLKATTDESFDEIQRLCAELIRIHLMPGDFSDEAGNLSETIWLDIFDYTMAQAQNRGLYIYLTFLNHLDHDGTQFPYDRNSFAAANPREEWMVDSAVIAATKNNIRQLLNRRNPYNGLLYKNHDALAVLEPVNEPAYYWFEKWLEKNEGGTREQFEQWSYGNTKSYLNDMVELFRDEGMAQPVVWNCGWARLIQKNRAAFRGIADSNVDAVSFCLYPGQSDLKTPFWENPEELSNRNYLPYIQQCSENEDWLGWLRSDAFKGKAKLVYEFETFCNQSGYLYPAMAKFYRSVGAQIAAQWTYGLTAYAEYLGGSHVFNLKTTPKKAASFMVAKQQFKDIQTSYSFESRSSSVFNDGKLIYSGKNGAGTFLSPIEQIIGVGNSPFVTYAGTGLYFIKPVENGALHLEIMPDTEFIRPHWKELHTGDPVVELDLSASHEFELKLPDLGKRWVYRKEGYRWKLVAETDGTIRFKAGPGEYLIEKQKLIIDRKLLEEGWGN